jgi:hypothetical protein
MISTSFRARCRAGGMVMAALGLGLVLSGCQKTTTTTETPGGTSTTTTYGVPAMPALSASASAVAASAMSGASQALGKAEERLDDGALTAKVKTALLTAADVKALQINVDSKDGVVSLSGTQETATAIERAVGRQPVDPEDALRAPRTSARRRTGLEGKQCRISSSTGGCRWRAP